jgi:Domain of unknown function (DUF5666)
MTQETMGAPDGVEATGQIDGDTISATESTENAGRANNEVFDVLFGGESEAWPEQSKKKGPRASWPVALMVALLLVIGGVALGSYLQRSHSPTTSATGRPAGFAGFAGFGGAGAAAGGTTGKAAASTGVTSGTVTDIIGNTVYVTNSSGNLVKVTVSSTTTVDRNAASSVAGLRPGDTVTVQGSTATNGTVSAASISATAKGVTVTGGGGFGGFGGGGAGAAAGG